MMLEINKTHIGHVLHLIKKLDDESIDCVITSPPYWGLRDYSLPPQIWDGDDCEHEWGNSLVGSDNLRFRGKNAAVGNNRNEDIYSDKNGAAGTFCIHCNAWRGSLGLEPTFQLYLDHLMQIMAECKRVLKKTGIMWVNIGDSYNGSGQDSGKSGRQISQSIIGEGRMVGDASPTERTYDKSIKKKSLIGIPERFVIRMTDELQMIRRNTIVWYKRNCMPSSAKDRFTVDFEFMYFFTKSGKYWFEQQFEPHLTQESRPDGIVRNREYGYDSKLNSMKQTKIPKEQAENYGSPRARYHRETKKEWFVKPDGKSGNEYTKIEGRNKRCVWDITTKPFADAHFAVFPEELVRTPILVGCPKEICNKCGKTREKILEPSEEYKKHLGGKGFSNKDWIKTGGGSQKSKNYPSLTADYRCVGYTDCGCNAGFHPGIVLDPFMGSGTVGKVALALGRNYIGFDLGYDKMSKKRTGEVQLEAFT